MSELTLSMSWGTRSSQGSTQGISSSGSHPWRSTDSSKIHHGTRTHLCCFVIGSIIDDAPQFTCGTYVLCITTCHAVGNLSSMMDFTYAYARHFVTKPYYLSTVPKCSHDHLRYFDTSSTPAAILPLLTSIPGLTILPLDQPLPPSLSRSQLTSPTSTPQLRDTPNKKCN